jgi:hypothetical protein
MEKDADVSVVIPSHNNARFLERCLNAILQNGRVREIVVVDDASTDESINILGKYRLQIIRNQTNIGPVRARNLGARKCSGKYLLFLDSDIELPGNYVRALSDFFDAHPRAGGATGKIISTKGDRLLYGFGYRFSLRSWLGNLLFVRTGHQWNNTFLESFLRKIARYFTLSFVADRPIRVDWAIESAFMTPRKLFEQIGGFDENFFMFHEGPDYCERARAIGVDIWYVPTSPALHLDGNSHNKTRNLTMRKSTRYYLRKHGLRLW